MEPLEEQEIACPYCGETITVLVDPQEAGHEYIEDCQVCCKPMVFSVSVDPVGHVSLAVRDENESY